MSLGEYDARMIEVWRNAALQPGGIVLSFLEPGGDSEEARKKAIVQRHRFYRLRKELERTKHNAYPNAAKCLCRLRLTAIEPGTGKTKEIYPSKNVTWKPEDIIAVDLHFVPHAADKTLDKALAGIGVKPQEAPSLD